VIAVGKDKPGLVAGVTTMISKLKGNIEEMDQVVLRDVFVMSLLIKFLDSENLREPEELKEALISQGEKIGLKVHIYPLKDL